LPWHLRIALRSLLAQRRLRRFAGVWPIDPLAGRSPRGWTGWPESKRFAVVLTHDVETGVGLGRCRHLMELEKNLGFRSSFNFIPEGPYTTPPELRELLTRQGFEVGVHDLKHDGKLYNSRRNFRFHAQRINQYLSEWNAVGFRSGFMHHNLDWLHELNIEYDASTFDTDPFEPQPDGVGTIFPFLVKHKKGSRDYLELPYTLPQDSTLFLLLREGTIDIWTRKLDWIAQRGGMALLNTHPDYMAFEGRSRRNEYPARFYGELLQYLKTAYQDSYWLALPSQLAAYVRQESRPPQPVMDSDL
jgi:hypothetical protein